MTADDAGQGAAGGAAPPPARIRALLKATGKASIRERDLPGT